jgi:hypothetical protein
MGRISAADLPEEDILQLLKKELQEIHGNRYLKETLVKVRSYVKLWLILNVQ